MAIKVSPAPAFLYLLKRGKWRAIEEASVTNHPAREAAYVATRVLLHPSVLIDFQDPVSVSLLNSLEAAGLITSADSAAIQGMSA